MYQMKHTRKLVNEIYSVIHNSIATSKKLCSKMALGEVRVSLLMVGVIFFFQNAKSNCFRNPPGQSSKSQILAISTYEI